MRCPRLPRAQITYIAIAAGMPLILGSASGLHLTLKTGRLDGWRRAHTRMKACIIRQTATEQLKEEVHLCAAMLPPEATVVMWCRFG